MHLARSKADTKAASDEADWRNRTARAKAEEEARRKKEAEARAKAEAKARAKAEAEAKAKAEAEEKARLAAEAKARAKLADLAAHSKITDEAVLDKKRAVIEAALARSRARRENPSG